MSISSIHRIFLSVFLVLALAGLAMWGWLGTDVLLSGFNSLCG